MSMNCARCHNQIGAGQMYVEAKRHGEHDVYRETEDGYPIHYVPLTVHIDCPAT